MSIVATLARSGYEFGFRIFFLGKDPFQHQRTSEEYSKQNFGRTPSHGPGCGFGHLRLAQDYEL